MPYRLPGEPMLYPDIVELVRRLKDIEEVAVVSMQSNGTRLDEDDRIFRGGGADRINLSMHALEPELAAYLAGRPGFDIKELERVAVNIARSRIDLLIAPVYIRG